MPVYSFVAGAGLTAEQHRRELTLDTLLRSSAADVVRQLPDLGARLRIQCRELPEIAGGWATIRPEPDTNPPLIAEYCDSAHAVLVFGDVDAAKDAATAVCNAYIKGGAQAVAALGGMFSAIVVERLQRRLHVVTSVPGCRSLRCRQAGAALFLAPTDLGVVALSHCDIQLDLGALATVLETGWSLGGGSAIKGVKECQPHETWTWTEGQVSIVATSPLEKRDRIDRDDKTRVEEKLDQIIEELRSGVRHHLGYYDDETVTVPLTAGIDSRAVLALILSVTSQQKVSTYTRGTESQDVRVARWLSRHLRLEHETRPPEPPSLADFAGNARLLSVLTNGTSNAHAAVKPRFSVRYNRPAPFGAAGEVFRGFYYKYLWRQRGGRAGANAVAEALMAAPLKGLRAVRFANPSLDGEAPRRLVEVLTALEAFSQNVYDLCDLFYIFERMGRWGSTVWRDSLGPSFFPFANHRAMTAAFELPAPMGENEIVPRIIARFLPRSAYWLPVNGANLLALEGRGSLRRVAREGLRVSAKLVRETRQRLLPGERSPAKVRLDYLSKNMTETINDTLRSSGSVAHMLFTGEQLSALLQGRTENGSQIAGALLSLDLWKQALDASLSGGPT